MFPAAAADYGRGLAEDEREVIGQQAGADRGPVEREASADEDRQQGAKLEARSRAWLRWLALEFAGERDPQDADGDEDEPGGFEPMPRQTAVFEVGDGDPGDTECRHERQSCDNSRSPLVDHCRDRARAASL